MDYREITPLTPEKELPAYWPAEEVEAMAKEIIEEHHPALVDCSIVYLFKKKAPRSGESVQLGSAAKVSTKWQLIANYLGGFCHFIVEIGWDQWLRLSPDQRRALVDHELTHCDIDYDQKGNKVPVIRRHDVEEFHDIILRHGLWKMDLQATSKVMKQVDAQLGLFEKKDDGNGDAEESKRVHADEEPIIEITAEEVATYG